MMGTLGGRENKAGGEVNFTFVTHYKPLVYMVLGCPGLCCFKAERGDRETAREMNGDSDSGAEKGQSITLEELKKKLADFAMERDWDPFHSPRNLLLALVGEVGELSEIFQWKGEVPRGLPGWEEKEKVHLGEELSDVLLYLIRLSDICGIDLGKAALRKIKLNAIKYPAKLGKGSSKEYNGLSHNTNEDDNKSNGNIDQNHKSFNGCM